MNPYKTPNEESTIEDGVNGESVADLTEHRSYNLVLKMVLWGDSREDVFHRLSVNKVPDDLAHLLYEHARQDRVRTIRSDCTSDILTGLGLIVLTSVFFCGFWFGLSFIPLLYGCFAALGIGLWKFTNGIADYLMAPNKKGSLVDYI